MALVLEWWEYKELAYPDAAGVGRFGVIEVVAVAGAVADEGAVSCRFLVSGGDY